MTEKLFDNAPCGYFSFFDDGTLFHVNETLCAILGYTRDELVSTHVENIFTLPARIFYQTHLFPLVLIQGHAEELFLFLLSKSGEHLPVLLNANRSQTGEKAFIACACIVVPNRKKFEDELIAARKAAETALKENSELQYTKASLQEHAEQLDLQIRIVSSQNQELKQLNHAVTHNLKEPLRKILVYSEKLQQTTSPADLNKLTRAAEQMKSVVSALQEYVWLDEKRNQFVRTDLNTILDKAVQQVSGQSSAGKLSVHSAHLPEIEADPAQIQLMFYHILQNAVKFRKGDVAQVTVSCTTLRRNVFTAVSGKYKYADFARLEVRDEGTGFDPSYGSLVFELFRKLNNESGQGIGLALCKRIVQNHLGQIEAESKLNQYTIIRIWLPLALSL